MSRILIIDDDEKIRGLVGKVLEKAGFEILLAEDGKRGIQLFKNEDVDLVIVDIWMPEKDGLDTLMDIRRNKFSAKVIAMSGGGRLEKMRPLDWAKRLGAVAVLTKPFTNEELLNAAVKALDSYK